MAPFVTGVGASGAIFGVYGGIAACLAIRHRSIRGSAAASLGGGVVVVAAYNLVFGFFQQNVDAAAHVGGLLTGLLVGSGLAVPVPTRMRGWTVLQPALVGLAGTLVIAGSASRLPRVDDLRGALRRMGDVERHTNSAFEQLLGKLQQSQITPDQFAQQIEQQVLPPWDAARDEFAHMRAGPEQQTAIKLVRYMSLRSEAMHLTARGLAANAPAMLAAAHQKAAEAKALSTTLTPQATANRRSSGGGATEVSISGTIKEIALPVGGALVSLSCPRNPKPPVSRVYLQVCDSLPVVRSDAEGRFRFNQVPPGNYVVRVKADGYVTEEQPTEVHDDATLAFGLRPAVDVKAVVAGISSAEHDTVSRFNAALGQLRAHRVSNERFSQLIETDVLPAWEERRAELVKLKPTPGQQQIVDGLIKYMQLRAEAWRLLARAARTNDVSLMTAAKRKQDEAMALAKGFGTRAR